MCDVVHALLLQQLDAQVLTDQQVAAVLILAGAKDVPVLTVEDARAEFDRALEAVPANRTERDELLEALGVRG